ncbi:MAG TPA: hypothetical protein VF974_04730 [Patescibacteria group bacterium]
MEESEAKQATPEEMREHKRKCWNSACKKTAWFQDWAGWNWCWYHAYYNNRWGGGNRWFEFKTLKLRWPYENTRTNN